MGVVVREVGRLVLCNEAGASVADTVVRAAAVRRSRNINGRLVLCNEAGASVADTVVKKFETVLGLGGADCLTTLVSSPFLIFSHNQITDTLNVFHGRRNQTKF